MYVWDGTANNAGATGTTTWTSTNAWDHVSLTIALRGVQDDQSVGGNVSTQTIQSGVGAVAVAWPTHAANDVAFLVAETQESETPTLSTPAGFTLVESVASSNGGVDTRCTVWWKRATTASEATPTIADPGDHCVATMTVYRNCRTTGNPWWSYTTGNDDTASTSSTIPSITTEYDGEKLIGIMTQGADAAGAWASGLTNANLNTFVEKFDDAAIDGNGGGIHIFDCYSGAPGVEGTTAVTLANSSKTASFMFRLAPVSASKDLENIGFSGYGADGSDASAIYIEDSGGHYTFNVTGGDNPTILTAGATWEVLSTVNVLSLIHISEPTRPSKSSRMPSSA